MRWAVLLAFAVAVVLAGCGSAAKRASSTHTVNPTAPLVVTKTKPHRHTSKHRAAVRRAAGTTSTAPAAQQPSGGAGLLPTATTSSAQPSASTKSGGVPPTGAKGGGTMTRFGSHKCSVPTGTGPLLCDGFRK